MNEVFHGQQSPTSSDPALLKVTEAIADTFDAKAGSGIAVTPFFQSRQVWLQYICS
jgi:hypothetical protein